MNYYKCGRCGTRIPADSVKNVVGGAQCRFCGYKVLYKERPIVKQTIKAR
jgi:DNA-directed RNA polymerase subunit RPC12/RpoP